MIDQLEYGMSLAIKEAERAYDKKEIPVGAVVLHEGRVIGKGYNQVETLKDPTAHAEILAITAAASYLGSKWLHEADLFVTKEPCPMCAGAIVLSRLRKLVIGAMDAKAGACGSVLNIVQHPKLNHRIEIISGIHEQQCSHLLTSFFEELRREK